MKASKIAPLLIPNKNHLLRLQQITKFTCKIHFVS